MIFGGILLELVGLLLIYLQIEKKYFYKNNKRDDFYIPTEIRSFWGIVAILILSGLILMFQK